MWPCKSHLELNEWFRALYYDGLGVFPSLQLSFDVWEKWKVKGRQIWRVGRMTEPLVVRNIYLQLGWRCCMWRRVQRSNQVSWLARVTNRGIAPANIHTTWVKFSCTIKNMLKYFVKFNFKRIYRIVNSVNSVVLSVMYLVVITQHVIVCQKNTHYIVCLLCVYVNFCLFVWIFTARQHITGHIVPNAIKGLKC
jgi:hypothetical protein